MIKDFFHVDINISIAFDPKFKINIFIFYIQFSICNYRNYKNECTQDTVTTYSYLQI